MSEGLQVIGVGLHRTGSMSVKAALERVGYGPCYHGMEALRRCRDGDHWLAAFEAGGAYDWSRIFAGYRATMDWPTVAFWEQLAAAYPDAKILLTERDPESWWQSHQEMFRRGLAYNESLTDDQRQWAETSGWGSMQAALGRAAAGTFEGRIFDKEHCLRVFELHNERVKRTVPAERLLVYRVQEGWEPLCRFLGVDVPDEPFPHVNVGGDGLVDNIDTAMRLARAQTGEPAWR
jgi:Sulfotransferase domain